MTAAVTAYCRRVSFRDLKAETVRPLAVRAHHKGLELICDIAPEVLQVLVGDPGRLRQVLGNRAGTAITLTEAGDIVIAVNVAEQSAAGAVIHLEVSDTGVGIAAGKLDLIFGPFSQADGSTTRRFGGTGLGLTISSKLIELMGGRVWADRVPGAGSTFHATARFGIAAAVAEEPEAMNLAGLRVLVVDDNAVNCRYFEKTLERWRMTPTIATDGPSAPATIAAAAPRAASADAATMEQLIARLEGDEALAGEMAAIFVRECPALLERVHDAVRRNAALDLLDAAHALKGAVANFSTGAGLHRAAEVEQLARAGGVAAAAESVEKLDGEIAALVRILEAYTVEHQLCAP